MRSALLILAACGGESGSPQHKPHAHARVDPRLQLALVVPRDTKNIGGAVLAQLEPPNLDAAGFAAKVQAENPHSVIPKPATADDKGLVLSLDSAPGEPYPHAFRIWYRTITGPGGPVGVSCFVDTLNTKPEIVELTKASCDGIQLVDDGIYVPFSLAGNPRSFYTDHNRVNLWVHLATTEDPPDIDKVLDIPKDKRVIDRRQLTDGWAIFLWASYLTNHEYQGKVRRTLGGHDVWCDVDASVEDKARAQYEHCLALEAL